MVSVVTILVVLIGILPLFSLGSIGEFLNYYETLHHNNLRHQIRRRDLYLRHPTERSVEFVSHRIHFKLILHLNNSLLSSNFNLMVVNEKQHRLVDFDAGIYSGYLEDEPTSSFVSAYWDHDESFTATIWTKSDVFVVEPSWRHLPLSDDYSLISYRGSDVVQMEASDFETAVVSSAGCDTMKGNFSTTESYSAAVEDVFAGRQKRESKLTDQGLRKKTCSVLIVADYRFYEKIGRHNELITAKYIIGLMHNVDQLFRSHTFAECGNGFGFEIGMILIHDEPSGDNHYNNNNLIWSSSSDLLRNFSSRNMTLYSNYCLVHLFTAIPFSSLVFGIANVAKPSPEQNGGLCSNKIDNTLNTAWTTFVDRNSDTIPYRQVQLVAAHEFGHNWGSNHDPDNSTACSPRHSGGGKYLMYASAVNGFQKNNYLFSNCSIRAICDVLKHKSKICLKDKSDTVCGNYIRENGEECDEGPIETQCCKKCHFKDTAKCSNVNDKCCDQCQIANSSKICHFESDKPCTKTTYCSGSSVNCSTPDAQPDQTSCMGNGKCFNRKCLTLCEYSHLNSCLCDSEEFACKVCCQNSTGESDTCEPFWLHNSTVLENVVDNTQCAKGVCIQGICQPRNDSNVYRAWNFIDFKSVAGFVKFMRNNIVGTVIFLSLLFWIPASCAVSRIDQKRAKRDLEGIDWLSITNNMLIPQNECNSTKIRKVAGTIDRKQFCGRKNNLF